MKQFFLLGASSVYGVGGANGGWAELLKQYLHHKMYAPGGEGEMYEVFNFAKSGATTQFVLDTFPGQIRDYGRSVETAIVVSVGGNDSKATGTPDNYVSTVEDYTLHMHDLLTLLKQHADQVLVANNGFVDEAKVNPKSNPFNDSKSYFTNARRLEFRAALRRLCDQQAVTFVDVDVSQQAWQEKYLYTDGLHPNDAGHQRIFEAVREKLAI